MDKDKSPQCAVEPEHSIGMTQLRRFSRLSRSGVFAILAVLAVSCSDSAGPEETNPGEGAPVTTLSEEGTPSSEGSTSTTANAEAFYAGKTIDLLISTGPGGGTDRLARFTAEHLPTYIAGNPTVIPENMEGSGGILGMNEFYLNRERDGLTIGMGGSGPNLNYLMGEPNVQYDYRNMIPVIGSPEDGVIIAHSGLGVESAQDLYEVDEPLFMGQFGSPVGAPLPIILAFEVLQLNDQVEQVFGYESNPATDVAFEAGELDLDESTSSTMLNVIYPEFVENGEIVPLFVLGTMQDGEIIRDPNFPDLPTVPEVYEEHFGEPPSGPAWEAYKAILAASYGIQKIWWMHADDPPEAVAAIQEGVAAMAEDPGFQAAVEEGDVFLYPILYGDRLQSEVDRMLALDEETLDWAWNWLAETYDVERP